MNILVVDDDDLARLNLSHILTQQFNKTDSILEASSQQEACDMLQTQKIDLVFIDLDLERELAGLEIIGEALARGVYPIVLSGREESSVVERAYEAGCADFLSKPLAKDSLELVLQKYYFMQKYNNLQGKIFEHYITQDNFIIEQLHKIEEIILSKMPVLILGPSGTGKTQIAKIIHQAIIGSEGPFIHLNCAEIPENLVESELFGYVKGAFSGADSSKKGKLELADSGTLFLDEIAAMPLTTQQKLLVAIEEKSFYPLGSEKKVSSEFRLISATCDDLEQKIKEKEFRQDFYFRIAGHKIQLPPLKDRIGDIPLLVEYFLRQGARRIVLSSKAQKMLEEYGWPGNIRELKFIIEMLQAKSRGIVSDRDILALLGVSKQEQKEGITLSTKVSDDLIAKVLSVGLNEALLDLEKIIVQKIYEQNHQKVRATIQQLQISTNRFYKVMKHGTTEDHNEE